MIVLIEVLVLANYAVDRLHAEMAIRRSPEHQAYVGMRNVRSSVDADLQHGSDGELAQELDVSIPTVKKMWLSIYRRVDQNSPEVNPNHPQQEVEITQRGKEKKRHLLIYLRKHPEELRPMSRKLLSKPPVTDRAPRLPRALLIRWRYLELF